MVGWCSPVRKPSAGSPGRASTPPTPADLDFRVACGLVSPVPSENRPIQTPALCTPANARVHVSPLANLRRESLIVPPSGALNRLCRGSGVTVYKMERSPTPCGIPRSPWVIKKADVSPLIAHELRRVERTLEHESRLLSQISHPNIVGFRAAQVRTPQPRARRSPLNALLNTPNRPHHRADIPLPFLLRQRNPDGQLCLALEACDCSLYSLIQDRQFARIEMGDHDRGQPLFSPEEIMTVRPTP